MEIKDRNELKCSCFHHGIIDGYNQVWAPPHANRARDLGTVEQIEHCDAYRTGHVDGNTLRNFKSSKSYIERITEEFNRRDRDQSVA